MYVQQWYTNVLWRLHAYLWLYNIDDDAGQVEYSYIQNLETLVLIVDTCVLNA
jgi:hypothetical protein